MTMLVCRYCGSSKVRNGYRPPPLPLRLILFRSILCDNCNAQFYAFSPLPPARSRERHRSHQQAEALYPASTINLSHLNQPASESVGPGREERKKESGFEMAKVSRKSEEEINSDPNEREKPGEKTSDLKEHDAEIKTVSLKQVSRPPCPRCRSVHTRRRHRNLLERLALSFSDTRPFMCEACGTRFYARKPLEEPKSRA